MSSHEKGYFVKMASTIVKQKKHTYLDLFNQLNKLDEYSDEALKAKLTKKKIKLNLAQAKIALENALIKSLIEYEEGNEVHNKLKHALNQYQVYFGKGMYDEAYKALIKQEELAMVSFSFQYYQEIVFKQMNLLFGISDPEMTNKVKDILTKLTISTKASKDFYECANIYYLILGESQLKENIFEKEKQKAISLKIKELEERKDKCLTAKATSFINRGLRSLYYSTDDFENALAITLQEIDSYHANPEFKKVVFSTYYQEFWHLIMSCSLSKNYSTLFEYKVQFENAVIKNPHSKAMQVYNEMELFQIELSQQKTSYAIAKEKYLHFEDRIEPCQAYLSPSGYLGLLFNQAKVAFLIGDYDSSLNWTNKLLDKSKPHLRQDVTAIASIFNLINHYHLENNLVLPYFLKQAYRSFKKMNRLTAFDKWVFKSLRKINNLEVHQFRKKEICKLKEEYITLCKVEDTPETGLDYVLWFDSLLEGKTMFEVLQGRIG